MIEFTVMKRLLLWSIGIGIASGALMVALWAQERQAQPPTPQAPSGPPATQADKVIFTFKDDAQIEEFTQLWQQHRSLLTRLAVLQAYWSEEQASLAQLNQQLLAKYNLDLNKSYRLDANRKALIEQETPPVPPAQIGQP